MWCGECLWFLACQAAARDVPALWRPPAPLGACYLLLLFPATPCPCLLQHATMQGRWLGMGMATQCPAVSLCPCLWSDTGEGSCSSCSSLKTTLPFLFLPVSKMADAAWKRTNGVSKGPFRGRDFSCWRCDHPLFYHGVSWCTEHPLSIQVKDVFVWHCYALAHFSGFASQNACRAILL